MRGIDIREAGTSLVFRVLLLNSTGDFVTGSTTSLRIHRLEADGTLVGFDFNDNTFKAAPATPTASMTHQQVNTVNTGIWTYAMTGAALDDFTEGRIYIINVNNTTSSPPNQGREFQYGDGILLPNEYDTDIAAVLLSLTNINNNTNTLLLRLTESRANFLDKLNVTGVLANSDDADLYKADLTEVESLLDELVQRGA